MTKKQDEKIEKYITSLPWSPFATEREKTLVAGNIRAFYDWLTNNEIINSDVVINTNIDKAVYNLSKMNLYISKDTGVDTLHKIAAIVGWEAILVYAMQELKINVRD
jgi:hypothetical protein